MPYRPVMNVRTLSHRTASQMIGGLTLLAIISVASLCVLPNLRPECLAEESVAMTRSEYQLKLGVDANYSLSMEAQGTKWFVNNESIDLFEHMAKCGITEFRVRLWTKEDGYHGQKYATEIVQRALKAGLNPYLVIFLSDDWADLMKQPVPAEWKDLSFEQRKAAIHEYSRSIVQHFRNVGLQNHLYEIGNEIDYGICGEYPGKSSKKNAESLSRGVWRRSAELIKASQQGVLEADPDAKFMLHISHWWDADFCVAFFQFMKSQGVQIDYAGLSYFPSSNIGGSRDFHELGTCISRIASAIGCKVIIPETAYPSTRDFKGQFSRWKYEVTGYPLTEDGQKRWLEDFYSFCAQHPNVEAFYYWSPEWYGEGMWKGFALFDPTGQSKIAWQAFDSIQKPHNLRQKTIYLELRDNTLLKIPVDDAKEQSNRSVSELLRQTNGVNIEHIRLLEQTQVQVNGYSIKLKASLQKNLSLILSAPTQAEKASENIDSSNPIDSSFFKSLAPEQTRIVVVTRGEMNESCANAINKLSQYGFQVDLHAMEVDQPIVFGMSNVSIQSSN